MTQERYVLTPRKGYDLLRFGMSIENIRPLIADYGGVLSERSLYSGEEAFNWVMENFGTTEAARKSIIAGHEAAKKNKDLYRIRFNNGIDVLLDKNKLIEIAVDKYLVIDNSYKRGGLEVFFSGQNLFDMDGESLVKFVAQDFQENPYVDGEDIYFRENSMMVFGYCSGIKDSEIVWMAEEEQQHSSIVMYDGPRREDENFADRFIYKVI